MPSDARVTVGTLAGLTLAVLTIVAPGRLPQFNRETEQDLLNLGPVRWALTNGFLLGLGFSSRIGYWMWFLVPLGCYVLGSPAPAAAIWAVYGATRLGVADMLAWQMHRHPTSMGELSNRVLGGRPVSRRLFDPTAGILATALALWLGF